MFLQLKVFKPFFISLSLPFNMIRGENLTVNVIVFNYMSIRQNVSVSLEIREADNRSFTSRSRILVPAGEGVSIFVPVVPKNVGLMFLTATAQSSVAADRMQWKLPILPEGVKKYFNQPVFVDLRNVSMMNNVVTLPQNPSGHVNSSDKVRIC
jgi:CD109 antigen